MSKLDMLIEKLCPDGVKYKTLEDTASVELGKRVTKSEIETNPGPYPVWHGGERPMGYINKTNCPPNTVLVANTGSIGYINWINIDSWCSDAASKVIAKKDIINSRFLYHFLKSKEFKIKKYRRIGGVPTLELRKLKSFPIPLPPLPVQEEIVRILDHFTELTEDLTAKLTTELTARKQQYEYYRDQLLTFGDEVEWKALGDIAIIKNGKTYKKFGEGNIPVYGSGGVMTYIDTFVYDKPTVLIPRKGSIDKLYYLDIPFWNVDTVFYTILDENAIKAKFLFYYLKSQRLERLNTAGGVPSLTQAVLKLIQIPLPSLSEQARIVSILDKFDTLVNDISAGIPAEIEARKQQYEYYREKLLSFKELG